MFGEMWAIILCVCVSTCGRMMLKFCSSIFQLPKSFLHYCFKQGVRHPLLYWFGENMWENCFHILSGHSRVWWLLCEKNWFFFFFLKTVFSVFWWSCSEKTFLSRTLNVLWNHTYTQKMVGNIFSFGKRSFCVWEKVNETRMNIIIIRSHVRFHIRHGSDCKWKQILH